MEDLTAPSFLASSPESDPGLEEGFFGQHMSAAELDAEFLSRLEPSRFANIAELQTTTWYGYRFMHPGLRVFLFTHFYQKAYRKCAKMLGRRWISPPFMKANPFADSTKAQISGLVMATFTADAHGIPYEFWCDHMMEFALRGEIKHPLQPPQMYNTRYINYVLDKWKERNEAGIYIARAPQYNVENYVGHPWQDDYQDYLLEIIASKGNKAFWLSRLMHTVPQIHPDKATARFGADVVADAIRYV
jgi:hypothetical protein